MVKQKRRLQKGVAFALSLFLLLGSLAGCGGKPQEDTSGIDEPTNTYTPPVNEDGQIVITMPKTLLGGKTAEELEAEDKEQRQTAAQDGTLEQAVYDALLANEDGTFSYYLTKEQYPKLKAAYYWLGCLRDAYTTEISQEFVTEADYTDIDKDGIPWGLTVSVDAETYYSMEMWYSALVTVAPAVMLGRYQVLCGIPGSEWAVHVTVKDADIEAWRNRPLQGGRYPYVYVDGIYLRRNWGGEFENVAILVAIAVNEDGYREVLGAAEGMKEDKASWISFFQWLRGRGLDGVKLVVGDKCLGMLEAVGEVFPDAKYQRCTVHFYRNVLSVVPRSKVKLVAKMLKAIHAQESRKAAREKAELVIAQLLEMKLKEAAKKVQDGVEETLTYCDFPYEHWTRIRTNNVIERLNREIRRRTRVVGTFPDGNSALMLVCARLRHVAGTQWGNSKYMNMKHLEAASDDASIAG